MGRTHNVHLQGNVSHTSYKSLWAHPASSLWCGAMDGSNVLMVVSHCKKYNSKCRKALWAELSVRGWHHLDFVFDTI